VSCEEGEEERERMRTKLSELTVGAHVCTCVCEEWGCLCVNV
jgi:hypothetical protein